MKSHTVDSIGSVNSIGFIRLICALLVVVGHSFPLGGFGADPLLVLSKNQIAIGRVPVDVFFCLSGFLIAKSFESRRSLLSFAWARFLRVYPAYWVCITLTAFLLPMAFGFPPSLSYFLRNVPLIVGGQAFVPELNVGHFAQEAINGALWTLPWELKAYALCALFGLLGGFKRRWPVVVVFLWLWGRFVADIYTYPGLATSPAVTSYWRLFTFFAAGMVFYEFRRAIPLNRALCLASWGVLLAALAVGVMVPPSSGGVFYAIAPLPLTYVVFHAAKNLPFEHINSSVDFSYGVYIYGTLMLNVLVLLQWHQHWWVYMAAALTSTFILASMSWYLIEKPALRAKNMMG